jgi:hypothetical protein
MAQPFATVSASWHQLSEGRRQLAQMGAELAPSWRQVGESQRHPVPVGAGHHRSSPISADHRQLLKISGNYCINRLALVTAEWRRLAPASTNWCQVGDGWRQSSPTWRGLVPVIAKLAPVIANPRRVHFSDGMAS